MAKSELNPFMTRCEIISTMAEGCGDLVPVLASFLRNEDGYLDLSLLDMMGIRGMKLERLINDCCQRNIEKLNQTILMFRSGAFQEDEIVMNLNFSTPVPFFDDTLKLDGVSFNDKTLLNNGYLWKQFCKMQHDNFQTKYQEKVIQLKQRKTFQLFCK